MRSRDRLTKVFLLGTLTRTGSFTGSTLHCTRQSLQCTVLQQMSRLDEVVGENAPRFD